MDVDRLKQEYALKYRADARLILLKALATEVDETLNSENLLFALKTFGVNEDRAWVHDELRWMANMGAVILAEAGTILVATLTEKGARHLAREIAIEGVSRPARPGG